MKIPFLENMSVRRTHPVFSYHVNCQGDVFDFNYSEFFYTTKWPFQKGAVQLFNDCNMQAITFVIFLYNRYYIFFKNKRGTWRNYVYQKNTLLLTSYNLPKPVAFPQQLFECLLIGAYRHIICYFFVQPLINGNISL